MKNCVASPSSYDPLINALTTLQPCPNLGDHFYLPQDRNDGWPLETSSFFHQIQFAFPLPYLRGTTRTSAHSSIVIGERRFGKVGAVRKHDLATLTTTGIIAAPIEPKGKNNGAVSIDEKDLIKGRFRQWSALWKLVGDKLGEEGFGKWLAQVWRVAAEPKTDQLAVKVLKALARFASDRTLGLGNGYMICRPKGKRASGFVAAKNEIPGRKHEGARAGMQDQKRLRFRTVNRIECPRYEQVSSTRRYQSLCRVVIGRRSAVCLP